VITTFADVQPSGHLMTIYNTIDTSTPQPIEHWPFSGNKNTQNQIDTSRAEFLVSLDQC
jgi:hypothetical protein